ncbi:hypothetical protein, partial [Citrobacter braakii]|uniref:hypothetical protein n=1 Tax=Citrobacter braakii TaxID=57706 RepID=UPI00197FD687
HRNSGFGAIGLNAVFLRFWGNDDRLSVLSVHIELRGLFRRRGASPHKPQQEKHSANDAQEEKALAIHLNSIIR